MTRCYKIKGLLECLLQDWMTFEGIEDFRSPFPRFGNQREWAVAVPLQYLNVLLLRNLTIEVVSFVTCGSDTSRLVHAWRKAISKPIPDAALHIVTEKGGSSTPKGFRQLYIAVGKLHGPTKGVWPSPFRLGKQSEGCERGYVLTRLN